MKEKTGQTNECFQYLLMFCSLNYVYLYILINTSFLHHVTQKIFPLSFIVFIHFFLCLQFWLSYSFTVFLFFSYTHFFLIVLYLFSFFNSSPLSFANFNNIFSNTPSYFFFSFFDSLSLSLCLSLSLFYLAIKNCPPFFAFLSKVYWILLKEIFTF